MLVEKGAYISNIGEVLLNSEKEWQQAKIIRTTTKVVQGGADVLKKEGGAGGGRRGPIKVLTLGVNTLILQGVDTHQSDTSFGRCQHLPKQYLLW